MPLLKSVTVRAGKDLTFFLLGPKNLTGRIPAGEKHRDGKLPYETVKRLLQDAGRLGTRNFLFIGGGEPLAEPHLPEYMQILNDSGVSVHLWTNGTMINEENAPLIARSPSAR